MSTNAYTQTNAHKETQPRKHANKGTGICAYKQDETQGDTQGRKDKHTPREKDNELVTNLPFHYSALRVFHRIIQEEYVAV